MTRLRKMMLEELERRNYSQSTTTTYIRTVEDFARYFKRRPDQLGPEHIREYQAQLFSKRKLAPNTVTQRLAAFRFFFVKNLHKGPQQARARERTSLPEEGRSSPGDPESGRSRKTHRRGTQEISTLPREMSETVPTRRRRSPSPIQIP